MALSSNKLSSSNAASGVAVATARPLSGGRNVASSRANPIEEAGFSPQIGVSDNNIYRYDDPGSFNFKERRDSQRRQGTPFVSRLASAFQGLNNESNDNGPDGRFQLALRRGISMYEETIRVTTASSNARPGAVINYLF